MKRSEGFTLVELLVVIGIIALLVTMLMPTLTRARELAKQTACGANLHGIGRGILIYVAEFDRFPLLRQYGDTGAALSNNTQSDDCWDPVLGTNAMQNLFLIIKGGTGERLFQCPSDGAWLPRPAGHKKYGWVRIENFSYGLHKPYDNDEKASGTNRNMAALNRGVVEGGLVIMTDKGNGTSVYWMKANDYNAPLTHKDDGFNCLAYEGNVKWYKTVVDYFGANSKAGITNDDVYVPGDVDGTKSPLKNKVFADNPTDSTDTFILPWKTSGTP